jgi:hypothetical protein
VTTLNEVLAAMSRLDVDEKERVAQEQLKEWMKSDEVQALGAIYYLIFDKRYYPRIEPALSFEDYKSFLLPYYDRCFREDPQVDWASTRYTAGWDLVGWFMGLWRDGSVPRKSLEEIKRWMADIYRNGDEQVRNCLVTATLEHLFEDRKVAKFFIDWRGDPILKQGYSDALAWSAEGSSSPFGRRA